MSRDPVRLDLSDDAPAAAVEALRQARRDAPDAARLAAIEAAVLVKLAPPTGRGGPGEGEGAPPEPGAGPAPGGSSLGPIAKAGAVALAAGAAVVVLALATRSAPAPVDAKRAPTAVTAPPTAPPTATETTAIARPEPVEPPVLSVDDLPSAGGAASGTKRPLGALPSARSAPSAADPAESERAEVALLDRAQASLHTRPADTLASCEEHARRFASGALVQEREVLAIDALVRLGRRDAAEARAARFRLAFPRSGHLRRIDALLAR
jgi:hypothetical protein